MIYILNEFCETQAGYKIMGFLGIIINIIKIIVPILLILLGTIDLVKCIMSNEKEIKPTIKKLITKVICAVAIFFVPSIVMMLTNMIEIDNNNEKCISCLLEIPTTCIEIGNNMSSNNNSNSDGLCSLNNGNEENCKAPCEYVNGFCQKID